jgi:hypothetical protein
VVVGVVVVVDAEAVGVEEVKFLAPIYGFISLAYTRDSLHPRKPFSFLFHLIDICTHLCQGLCNIQIVFEQYIPMLCLPIPT